MSTRTVFSTTLSCSVDGVVARAGPDGAIAGYPAGKAPWGDYVAYLTPLDAILWEVISGRQQ